MSITNTTKPSSSYANTARPTTGLIWNDATMTWNAQTDTWLGTASLIDNTSRVSSSMTNVVKP